jgi:DNA polymerase-3 subunit delta'
MSSHITIARRMVLVYDGLMWKNIIGHKEQIELFKSMIVSGKVPHAFLFSGPVGLGKTKVAHEFFKAVNCLESPGYPCDACRNCVKADSGSHPDLIMLGAENGVIQVKDVRAVISDISLKPFEARLRVIILEPAEQLNKASANAILKTLEEPPQGTVIILVSHKPTMLLPTIVSRCQIIRFTPLDASTCSEMSIDPVLLKLTSGSIGGLSMLDDEDIVFIRAEIVNVITGTDPFNLISKYFPQTNPSKEAATIFLLVVESVVRDILVLAHGGDKIINEELKEIPIKHVSIEDIDNLAKCIHGIRQGMNENINIRVAISELLMMFRDSIASQ